MSGADLLFLTQRIPYPPDKGDKIRAYHTLRHLAERFRIHLGCFVDNPRDFDYLPHLRALCATVHGVPLKSPLAMLRGACALARGGSLSESYFHDARMVRWVASAMASAHPETIFVFCSSMAPYAMSYRSSCRVVLDMVDVDSEKWRAYGKKTWWPLSALYAREQRALFSLERRAALAFERSFFVSREEARMFLSLAPEAQGRVDHFDNGVDLEYFDPTRDFPSPFGAQDLPIVFTGSMSYAPNVEAAIWFAETVLPRVRSVHERARFWIVGADPAPSVRKLARQPFVRVTGRVFDVRPYLAHAACVVAPLHIARGVQNKMLEAFAMAKPVVATPNACEGIRAVSGSEVLLAETPAGFAEAVCAVLAGKAAAVGPRARQRVQTDHDWSKNLQALGRLLDRGPRGTEPAKSDRPHEPVAAAGVPS